MRICSATSVKLIDHSGVVKHSPVSHFTTNESIFAPLYLTNLSTKIARKRRKFAQLPRWKKWKSRQVRRVHEECDLWADICLVLMKRHRDNLGLSKSLRV